MMKKLWQKIFFSKLSVTIIILVTFIILASMLISSQVSAYFIKTDTRNNSMKYLKGLVDLTENELNNINSMVTKLSLTISEDKNLDAIDYDYFHRFEVSKEINKFGASNTYVNSIYVFFNQGEKVYFSSYKSGARAFGVKNSENFFETGDYNRFVNEDQISSFIGTRVIKPNYFDNPLIDSGESKVMTIMKRFPFYEPNSKNIVMVNIEEKHMLKLIAANYVPQKSIVLITDQKGDQVFSLSSETNTEIILNTEDIKKINQLNEMDDKYEYSSLKINGAECFVTQVNSDVYNWKYTLIVPESVLLKSVTTVNIVIFLFSIFVLIIGGVFSILIDRKYFQPILRILKLINSRNLDKENKELAQLQASKERHKNNELKQLEVYVDDIILKSDNQEKQLQRYFLYYKERNLLAFLNGDSNVIDMPNLNEILSKKTQGWHCCILLTIKKKYGINDDDNSVIEDYNIVMSEIENCLSVYGQTDKIIIDRYKIVILLNMQIRSETSELKDNLQMVLDSYQEQCLVYNIAIGSLIDSFKRIRESFLEAEKTLMYLQDTENNKSFDANETIESHESDSVCSYPGEIEKLIFNDICLQDYGKVTGHIHLFYKRIKDKKGSAKKAKKYSFLLLYNLTQQFNEIGFQNDNNLGVANIFEEIENLDSINQLELWMVETLSNNLTNKVDKESDTHNKELIDKIINYIDEHYMDNDIGLNTIADYVYLSPSYLGKIFKEVSGTTFTNYIIKVRMEAAVDFLTNKNMDISDISEKVGYYSIQGFGRVFKNHYNCSPSEYRRKSSSIIFTGKI